MFGVRSIAIAFVVCALISVGAADGPLACGYTAQGATIDLSPLTVVPPQPDYVSAPDSSGYVYELNVCAASTTSIAQCANNQAAICQIHNGAFVSTVARWPPSGSPSGFTLINGDINQGIELQFANGDACFPSEQPRTSRIMFVCGTEPVGPISAVAGGLNNCDYTITVPTSYACVNSTPVTNCSVSLDGYTVDLSALHVQSGSDYQAKDNSGYVYDLNVCGVSTTAVSQCVSNQAAICQTFNDQFVSYVAAWPPSGSSTGLTAINDNNIFAGVQMYFANGAACYPSTQPRTATVSFYCFNELVGPINVTTDGTGCNYDIVFPTSAACPVPSEEFS